MDPALHSLLQRSDIWRAKTGIAAARPRLATGFAELDSALHGGWPGGALTELLLPQSGVGELRLLMPLLGQRPRPEAESQRPLHHIWIDPPLLPYAPALLQHGVALDNLLIVHPTDRAQWLWACLQALRSGSHSAVLCWSNKHRLRYAEVRQLQVAASEYGSLGFLLRDLEQDRQLQKQSTPAPLRLYLRAQTDGLHIEILKQRGYAAGQRLDLPQAAALLAQVPLYRRGVVSNKTVISRAARPLPAIDAVIDSAGSTDSIKARRP